MSELVFDEGGTCVTHSESVERNGVQFELTSFVKRQNSKGQRADHKSWMVVS